MIIELRAFVFFTMQFCKTTELTNNQDKPQTWQQFHKLSCTIRAKLGGAGGGGTLLLRWINFNPSMGK